MTDFLNNIIVKLLTIPGAVFAFTLAGFAKAFVSDKVGDPTPRNNNKLTMNPIEHIDPIGFIFIILFSIGWGKPVPTNKVFYKNYKRDNALVSLSEPVFLIGGGIVMSFIFALIYRFLGNMDNKIVENLVYIFYYAALICLCLANFYLLPLPGLPGYEFIKTFTPVSWNSFFYKIEKYSMIIFIVFILLIDFTSLSSVLFYPASALNSLLLNLWSIFLF